MGRAVKQSKRHPPKASLGIRKRELVRDAIWDAALELFLRKGFDQTTVEEIAEAAGVSRRSFFRYFSSKNDLMANAIVAYGQALTAAIAEVPATPQPLEMMRSIVLQVASAAAAAPRTRKFIEVVVKSPAARDAQLSRLAEVQQSVARAFAARGNRPYDDLTPDLLARLTLLLLDVTFAAWFRGKNEEIATAAQQAFAGLTNVVCGDRTFDKAAPARSRRAIDVHHTVR